MGGFLGIRKKDHIPVRSGFNPLDVTQTCPWFTACCSAPVNFAVAVFWIEKTRLRGKIISVILCFPPSNPA